MTGNDTEYFVKQLLATVEANDLSRLKGLLDHFNQSTYQTKLCNGFAHDSLDKALALGHYEIAQELFKHGMNWTYTTMDAVMDGGNESNDWNTKAIDVALANGWDINEHYDQVGNALVYAISVNENNLPMVSYLLEKGADPNEGSQSGSNPLETACLNGDKDIAKLLILHGATVKTSRALMEASENGDVELLQLLLDNGADINGRPDYEKLSPMFADDEGWGSALHCALKAYRVENVKFLLDQGAALNVKNPKGCTPLDLANKSGFEDIVKLFG